MFIKVTTTRGSFILNTDFISYIFYNGHYTIDFDNIDRSHLECQIEPEELAKLGYKLVDGEMVSL